MLILFKSQAQELNDSSYNNIISSGLLDKKGNLWFAASNRGIYRYDNKSFTHFTAKEGLSGNNVSCIYEDKSGILWFGTDGGVSKYDGKTFTAFVIPDSTIKSKYFKRSPVVGRILEDKKGNFWFLTLENGVYKYDGKTFRNFLSDEVLVCMIEDAAGNILVGSWRQGGAYRYDGRSFTRIDGSSDNMVFCLLKDKKGNIWIGTREHGVDKYNGKSIKNYSSKQGLCNDNVSCLFEDRDGNIWLGSDINWGITRGDACRYNGKFFENITANEQTTVKEKRLYSVRTIVQDKYGNLWFGSRQGLLLRYDGKLFTDFTDKRM